MQNRLYLFILLATSLFLVVGDFLSKWLARIYLQDHSIVKIFAILNFSYAENKDVAFSLLASMPQPYRRILILTFGIIMSLLILYLLISTAQKQRILGLSLSFILAGAIGNLIDRIFFGYVIDFIHFHINSHSWPIFNIADICITLGVIIMGIFILFFDKEPTPETEESH